jgi:hypothetical protein
MATTPPPPPPPPVPFAAGKHHDRLKSFCVWIYWEQYSILRAIGVLCSSAHRRLVRDGKLCSTCKKGKVILVLNSLSTTPWRHMGEWRYSSTILELINRWTWVVRFTPQPLYSQGNNHWYPLKRGLGRPQSHCGLYGEDLNLIPVRKYGSYSFMT